MQVVKYLGDRFKNLTDPLIKKIADGADGEVFLKKDGRVAKFSIFFPWNGENLDNSILERKLAYQKVTDNSDVFVKFFKFQHLMKDSRKTVDGDQEFHIFYYEMEKLEKTSDDERKALHSLISHEDMNREKSFDKKRILTLLDGLSFGLEFDYSKMLEFCERLQNLETVGIKYLDYHPRNVMKDLDGNFKLIDIDRMSIF